jgi:hypothetical protein
VRRLILLIALVALILRIVGLQFGLPAVYNPDEVAIMARALSFAKGTLNPHNFLYPTFYFYVLFGWVGIYLAFVWLTGGVASLAALQELYFTDPTGIYTAGRALSVACGTAGTIVLYKLGTRLFDVRVGLVSALFLAVSPLAVRDSHYVKHDVPATLAVLVAFLLIVRLWQTDEGRPLSLHPVVFAAAATGVAFSTHYYCIFLAIPLTYAIVVRGWSFGAPAVVRHLLVAAAVSAATFFVLSPFILVEPLVAWQDIVANRRIVVDRALEGGTFASAARYLDMLWNDSVGRPVLLLGISGAVWMTITNPRMAGLVLAFPMSFLLFIVNTAPGSRYLNPVVPFIALLAAWTLVRIGQRWAAPGVAMAVAAIACAVSPLTASIRGDLFFRQEDTRTLALRYIEQNVPTGTTVLVQPYSVPLTPSRASLVDALEQHLGGADAASTKFQIQLRLEPYPDPAYRLLWLGRGGLDVDKIYIDPTDISGADATERLRRLGVGVVVLKTSEMTDPALVALAAALDRSGQRLSEFAPFAPDAGDDTHATVQPFLHNADIPIHSALERPGPVLRIWRVVP